MTRFLAPPNSKRWAFALTAIAAAAAALPSHVYAQAHAPGAARRAPRVEDKNAVTTVRAEDISGRPERELRLLRDVEVVHDKMRVTSDTASFQQVEQELEAKGNVRIWRFGDYYTADELKLNMETGRGFMLQPTYQLELNNAQGKAQRINFLSED